MEDTTTSSSVAAPTGAEPASQVGAPNPAPAEPTVIDLSDESLIKIKGSDKPVKFSDHIRGFQSTATRAAQEKARFERELAAERAKVQRYEQERQQAASRQQGNPQQPDIFADLAQLPYLTGKDAITVVQSIAEQINQRDRIMLGLARELQKVQSLVGGLNESHTATAFESKIAKALQDNNLSADYADVAKTLYLSYEPGPELDAAFGGILAEYVENIKRIAEAERTKAVAAARKPAFVPGRGGVAQPSKPQDLVPANADARQAGELLWNAMHGGSGT